MRTQRVLVWSGENLAVAGQRFLGLCSAVAADLGAQARNARFLHEPGQAAVWGVVLRGGESRCISNVRLGQHASLALAAGDTQATNLSLSIQDSQRRTVSRRLIDDGQARPLAGAVVEPQSGGTYTITLTNAAEDRPATFALFGVVQVHEAVGRPPWERQQPVDHAPRAPVGRSGPLRPVSYIPIQ